MKKVCVFTGSRANYSSTQSIMRAIQEHSGLELQVVIGGAAILERYGNIESLLKKDGFHVDAKFHMIVEGENPVSMAKSTGLGIIDLSMIFNNLRPDCVLVVGDRFDIMAPVIAATYMNIPIAHTMGGEVSGTIDESIRHAITKMAHLHFPANNDAAARIVKMGERADAVFTVGCPRMDLVRGIVEEHRNGQRISQNDFFTTYKGVGSRFDLEKSKFLLVCLHPVTTEYGKNRRYVEELLAALDEIRMPTIMLWPNADAGTDEISKGIRTFREKKSPDWLHLFINLPLEMYIRLMDLCACMIGNSSSAVREGAFIGTPSVNVGSRQDARLRGPNLVDVDPVKEDIVEAINKQVHHGKYERAAIYGNGDAGKRIADVLSDMRFESVQKRITY